jgi:hypothetical protein
MANIFEEAETLTKQIGPLIQNKKDWFLGTNGKAEVMIIVHTLMRAAYPNYDIYILDMGNGYARISGQFRQTQ